MLRGELTQFALQVVRRENNAPSVAVSYRERLGPARFSCCCAVGPLPVKQHYLFVENVKLYTLGLEVAVAAMAAVTIVVHFIAIIHFDFE